MDSQFKDYYKILGVTYDASITNIIEARNRELMLSTGIYDEKERQIKQNDINEAFSVLNDSTQKREYDSQILPKYVSLKQRMLRNARTSKEYMKALSMTEEELQNETNFEETSIVSDDLQNLGEEENQVEDISTSEQEENQVEDISTPKQEESQVEDISTPKQEENQVEDISTQKQEENQVENLPTPTEEKNKNEIPLSSFATPKLDRNSQSEDKYINVPIDFSNKKTSNANSKISNVSSKIKDTGLRLVKSSVGGVVVFALVGTTLSPIISTVAGVVATGVIFKNLSKIKLKKHTKQRKIKEIKSKEIALIEEYNKRLDEEIDSLLSKKYNNYSLQIALTRYKNQIELLKKRIELKNSEKIKAGFYTKWHLELSALKSQLDRAEKQLTNIEEKIKNYNKNQRLSKLNDNLSNKTNSYNKAKEKKVSDFALKGFEKKASFAKFRRDKKAKLVKFNNQFVRNFSDGSIKIFDISKSYITKFPEALKEQAKIILGVGELEEETLNNSRQR